MFKLQSNTINQFKLHEIILYINRVFFTIYTCVINAKSYNKCKDNFLLLKIANMNTS